MVWLTGFEGFVQASLLGYCMSSVDISGIILLKRVGIVLDKRVIFGAHMIDVPALRSGC